MGSNCAEKPRARYYVNSNHNFNSATGTRSIAEATYNTGRSLPTILTELRYQNDLSFSDNDVYGASFGGQHRFNGTTLNLDLFRSNNDSNRDPSLAYVIRNQGYQFGYDPSIRWKPVYMGVGVRGWDASAGRADGARRWQTITRQGRGRKRGAVQPHERPATAPQRGVSPVTPRRIPLSCG